MLIKKIGSSKERKSEDNKSKLILLIKNNY